MFLKGFVGHQDRGTVRKDLDGFKRSLSNTAVTLEGSLVATQLVDIMWGHQLLAKIGNFVKCYKSRVGLLTR